MPRDSNNARLTHILPDPALRLLFREFLRYSLCEENMSFYLDVSEFTANYHKAEKTGTFTKVDSVRETLAAAYGKQPLSSDLIRIFFVPKVAGNLTFPP